MNELELKKLWQTANEKLEESLVLKKNMTDEISLMKVHTLLGSMKPIKKITLLVGVLWSFIGVLALSSIYVNAFQEVNKFFLFSATAQVLLTAIALFIYIYQLILLHHVEIYDTILETQEKLAKLQISTLWTARVLFLQLPVWTTFWWNESMLTDWNWFQWIMTIFITASFTILAIWLFVNIKYENRNKKWFKLIFYSKEWTPLMKSMEMLEQVNIYKSDRNGI